MADQIGKEGFTSGMAVHARYGEEVPTVNGPFGKALVEVGRGNPKVVGLTADLAKYTDVNQFRDEFPDRYFQVGMAEQNLIGITGGLARTGYIPFATSYCSFGPRRAYDFIGIGLAEAQLNAKIIMALPGITTGYGATHQGLEDMALMRSVPHMTVIDPAGATDIMQATRAMAEYDGPVYMRILRGTVKRVFNPESRHFEIGKVFTVREGEDATLVSSGHITDRAIEAGQTLAEKGIDVTHLHVPTVKPLNEEPILEAVARTGALVTAENHSVVGGLSTAVVEAIGLAGISVPIERVGIPDQYLECGSVSHLNEKYGLTARHIVEAAETVVTQK